MKFKPDIYAENVMKIDYQLLAENGIKLLCFDLDNTLDVPDAETTELLPIAKEVLSHLEKFDFEILIVSNNSLENRVKSFADLANLPYIAQMGKPFLDKYRSSAIISKYNPNQIAFIGDKMVTDVIGAHRFGSLAILTDPLEVEANKWYSVVMGIIDAVFNTVTRFKRGKHYNRLEQK